MEIIVISSILMIIFSSVSFLEHRRMRMLALGRKKSTIFLYARSFDYRNVDTGIVREVYNQVQAWAGKHEGIPFPVEADDCFESVYKMDPEDLDDMCIDIAKKLGISIESSEANPYWNKVATVKDLVLFLHNQPKVET